MSTAIKEEVVMEKESTAVFVSKGSGGWGSGLYLKADSNKKVVASLTGGGIHPVAKKISELLGVPVINAFDEKVDINEMICVVLDCGGTARMGIYPKKKVLTINVKPASPSGPLVQHITEDVFVSGVTVDEVKFLNGIPEQDTNRTTIEKKENRVTAAAEDHRPSEKSNLKLLTFPAFILAYAASYLYQAGKEAVNAFVTHVIPLMIGVAVLIGFFNMTNLDSLVSTVIYYSMGTLPGLLIMAVVFSIPIFSNYLGAGATLGQILMVLLGYEVALGNVDFIWMIPALFATNVQVGCDFLPTALSMSNSDTKTVKAGLKAVSYGRLFTSVAVVLVSYFIALMIGV